MLENVYEVVVVGAGPHTLSLLTKLLVDVQDKYEERPSNSHLFSYKNGKYQAKVRDNPKIQRTPRQISKFLCSRQYNEEFLNQICVIDKYGDWLNQWSKQFDILGISHLRSTISVQPEAYDLHSLMTFASNQKRLEEVHDISRDLRSGKFTGPFIIPSVQLFWDFSKHLVKLHNLENVVRKGEVIDVECLNFNENTRKDGITKTGNFSNNKLDICKPEKNLFKVTLKNGNTIIGKNIVIGIGNIGIKNIPNWFKDVYGKNQSILHTTDLIFQSKAPGILNIKESDELCVNKNQIYYMEKCVLIVGGGLSSGHLAIKAIEMGAKKVVLICRSELKVKQFDLDLEWIGRSRFIKLAEFYSIENPKKRLRMINQARQGGSITPFVSDKLKQFENQGKVQVFAETEVWSCVKENDIWNVELSNNETVPVNSILLATGSKIDVTENPLFLKIMKKFPIQVEDGLPVLTESLEWTNNSNVYVMGAYGALQLGPDALNLAGARGGASRISSKLKSILTLPKS